MTRWRRAIGSLLFLCVIGQPVAASERSTLTTAEGLSHFRQGNYREALGLFEQALDDDWSDVRCWYYRGVTRARLGDLENAVTDLRVTTLLRPEWHEAALELGVTLFDLQRFEEAVTFLEVARRNLQPATKAALFAGIAHFRLNQPDEALQSLGEAAADEDAEPAARFYEGRIHFERGDWYAAATAFKKVVDIAADKEVGRESARYVELIRQQRPQRYHLYGEVGLAYDSNVVLAPSDDDIKQGFGISRQADGRASVLAGGSYALLRRGDLQVRVGYEFFQSLYFELDQYNLQNHRPQIEIVYRRKAITAGVVGRYDYFALDSDNFLQQGSVLPWVRLSEGEYGYAQLFYRMRYRDYLDQRFAPRLDATSHALGLRQVFYLDTAQRFLSLGYEFGSDDARHEEGEPFADDAQQVSASLGWDWPTLIASSEVGYLYRREMYGGGSRRYDDEHVATLRLDKQINDYWAVHLGYAATINDSTQDEFTFERHLVSLSIEVGL